MVTAYVGLGANLGDPVASVRAACAELGALARTRRTACSRLYRNPPMGDMPQPEYVNAVAALETRLGPRDLLAALLAVEHRHGRERGAHWGARTLDLDLLLYGEREVTEPGLTVPHPGLPERPFVVFPLLELAPGLVIPGHGPLADLAARLDRGALVPVPDGP